MAEKSNRETRRPLLGAQEGSLPAPMPWEMKLLAYLLLLSLLALSPQLSAAAASPPAPPALALEEADEDEGEEDEEWEEGETEEEGEEDERTKAEPGLPQGVPDECLDYTVAARAVSSISRQSVQLEVSYDSYESGRASLSYALNGGRGWLKLGTAHWRLSRWGHLEQTAHLSDSKLIKLRAAKTFTVRVKMPGTPTYCDAYSVRHLSFHRKRGEQTVWSERQGGTQPQRPDTQR
jgi:hypothetical protein